MRPVTEAFLSTVARSHSMTARARLVPPGQYGTDPDGTEVPIIAGDVELDASAKIRGTADLTTTGTWPAGDPDSLFAPFGPELFLERGIRYGNGVTEWVSLGFYRLNKTEQAVSGGTLRLAGGDRMAGLEDAKLTAPRQFAAGAELGAVVEELVLDVFPAAVIEWDDDTETDQLGRSLVAESDRLGFLTDLVTGAGKVWAWDHRGVLVIRTAPDPAAPVATVAGGPGGVLVELERSLDRAGAFNGVVASGEGPDQGEPVRALVVDADTASPTYWEGPFGPVPHFYSSPLLTTTDQCELAARSILSRSLGLPYAVDFSAVPNPALEPLDPIAVAAPGENAETHTIRSLTIPLTPDAPLEATTLEQTSQVLVVI